MFSKLAAFAALGAVICAAAPVPPSGAACSHELEDFCSKDQHNTTRCLDCAEEHRATLEKANCTSTKVEAFCHHTPIPPGPHPGPHPGPNEACYHGLELECGTDRHNKTLCHKCVELHAEVLKKDNCTEPEEARFCEGPPVPPSPSAKCTGVLEEYCEIDRRNHTKCLSCATAHHNQTKAADCSYTEIEKFCSDAPPVPPTPSPAEKCWHALEAACEEDHHDATKCKACVAADAAALEKAGCTAALEERFCEPTPEPPKPNEACAKAFAADCGEERRNHTLCLHCADEHAAALRAAGCTSSAIAEECRTPEPPKPPSAACYKTLYESCEAVRLNRTKCEACATKFGVAGHCTEAEEHTFCHVEPPPPTETCEHVMAESCEQDHRNATMCHTCLENHAAALEKAKCTDAEEHAFCEPRPPTPPSEACVHLLVEECDLDKKNETKCFECIHKLGNKTTAAHCTYAQEHAFCHPEPPKPPTPPSPMEKCYTALEHMCPEEKHGGEKCTACVEAHAANATAAGCSAAAEVEFCKAA